MPTDPRPTRGPLPPAWRSLAAAARAASRSAHAPYSHLRVGAAIQTPRGKVYAACNVENASFGLTICAERAAIFKAISEGHRAFRRLLIYTPDAGPLAPCGACRQVLAEFCPSLPILSLGRGRARREFDLTDLLPEGFTWPDTGHPPAGKRPGRRERRPREDR